MNQKKDITIGISIKNTAIITAFSLLVMAIIAPFAHFYVLQNLIVPGEAETTINNIISSSRLFPTAVFLLFFNAFLDLVVAWGFYQILKEVNSKISFLSAVFRIIYVLILIIALTNLVRVSASFNKTGSLSDPQLIYNQLMSLINLFYNIWDFGLGIFGIHLITLGYLVFKSFYFPKFLGILVVISGFGYLIDSAGKFLLSNYNIEIALFTFIGEVLIIFWLFAVGFKKSLKNRSEI